MARAFTEQEKSEIREQLMEAALDLFHENGSKALSIKELTKRVGIAQGSFYNFWKDKDALIVDLISYRSLQKLSILEEDFSSSVFNPIDFLVDIIFRYSIDLANKVHEKVIYKDAFKVFSTLNDDETSRVELLYYDFLSRMIDLWIENKIIKKADKLALSNVLKGSFILCTKNYHFDKKYFEEILRIYLSNSLSKYIEI